MYAIRSYYEQQDGGRAPGDTRRTRPRHEVAGPDVVVGAPRRRCPPELAHGPIARGGHRHQERPPGEQRRAPHLAPQDRRQDGAVDEIDGEGDGELAVALRQLRSTHLV